MTLNSLQVVDCPLPAIAFVPDTPPEITSGYEQLVGRLGPIEAARAEAKAQVVALVTALHTKFSVATLGQFRDVRANALESLENERGVRRDFMDFLMKYRGFLEGSLNTAKAQRAAAAEKLFGAIQATGFDGQLAQPAAEPLMALHPGIRSADAVVGHFADALAVLDDVSQMDGGGNYASPFASNTERLADLSRVIQDETQVYLDDPVTSDVVLEGYRQGAEVEQLIPVEKR